MLINRNKFIVWLCLTVLFMLCIFFLSSMPYHSQDSKPFLKSKINLNADSLPKVEFHYDKSLITTRSPYDFIDFVVRKLGHVGEYFILTMLLLKTSSYVRGRWPIRMIVGAAGSLLFACTDEWHQSVVSERTGHLIDVWIPDGTGVALALICASLWIWMQGKRNRIRHSAFSE